MKKILIALILFVQLISFSKNITLASFNAERLGESKKIMMHFAR